VRVDRQLSRSGSLEAPKTVAAVRTLAVPTWLAQDLAELAQGKALGEPLWGALHYSNWRQRVWGPACARAGIPNLRFHDLRSLAATTMVRLGVDLKTAQARLGHATPAVTLAIYARATAETDRAAAEALGEVLRVPSSKARRKL